MGAVIHYNQRLGRGFSIAELRQRGFKAVFVAIGAQLGSGLRIRGEEPAPAGYMSGIEFQRGVNEGEKIIPGQAPWWAAGNVAMDCCRSALGLGVKQVRDEMPADKVEIHDAEEEGVIFFFQCNGEGVPIWTYTFQGAGLTWILCIARCQRCGLHNYGGANSNGRRLAMLLASCEYNCAEPRIL